MGDAKWKRIHTCIVLQTKHRVEELEVTAHYELDTNMDAVNHDAVGRHLGELLRQVWSVKLELSLCVIT